MQLTAANEVNPGNVMLETSPDENDPDMKKVSTENTKLSVIDDLIDIKTLTTIFNSYSTNKTIAQGFFNISLLTSNFAQMKQLIYPPRSFGATWPPLAITCMVFIGCSLLLQFVLAVMLVFMAKNGEFLDDNKRNMLIHSNNISMVIVIFITILNICINVFISIGFY